MWRSRIVDRAQRTCPKDTSDATLTISDSKATLFVDEIFGHIPAYGVRRPGGATIWCPGETTWSGEVASQNRYSHQIVGDSDGSKVALNTSASNFYYNGAGDETNIYISGDFGGTFEGDSIFLHGTLNEKSQPGVLNSTVTDGERWECRLSK